MKERIIVIDETNGLSDLGFKLKSVARQQGYEYYNDISDFIKKEKQNEQED